MPARTAVISLPITQVAQLERFDAVEHLSELFVIHADIVCREADVDFLPHLGEGALITVSDEGEQRQFSGLIYEAEFLEEIEAGFRYHLTLRPWLHALTRNLEFMIFQTMSVVDIIQKVFSNRGCTEFELQLHKSYPTRDYCVQYRETDFDFLSRLMEEEGIYYFFKHSGGAHTLVLCDDPASNVKGAYDSLPYLPHGQGALEDRCWRWTEQVSTGVEGKVTYRAWDFTQPTMQLEGTVSASPLAGGAAGAEDPDARLVADQAPGSKAKAAVKAEIYDFPLEFVANDRGTTLATTTTEMTEAQRRFYHGEGDALWLACGTKVTLEKHPLGRLNQEYLIVSLAYRVDMQSFVSTGGGGGGAEGPPVTVSVGAIPSTQRFRPPQRTPRPTPRGPETAKVVGPAGQTLYTDKYGRVKVLFHWDRVGKAPDPTCWIRVAWASADQNFGHIVLPRIGQEVLVDFVSGNPDEPVIVGSMYNAEKMPPYALPANATQSGWKSHTINGGADDFNEIRFEDKQGSEEVYEQAQKDRNRLVKHDETVTVKHDRTVTITGNMTYEVKEGNLSTTVDKGNETRAVSQGKRTTTIMMDETLTVQSGDMKTDVSSGDYSLKVDSGEITIEAAKKITIKCGSSSITMDPTSITMSSMMFKTTAQVQAELSAPMTKLAGDAMMTITGGIVKIN